jgi:hypothetical protein
MIRNYSFSLFLCVLALLLAVSGCDNKKATTEQKTNIATAQAAGQDALRLWAGFSSNVKALDPANQTAVDRYLTLHGQTVGDEVQSFSNWLEKVQTDGKLSEESVARLVAKAERSARNAVIFDQFRLLLTSKDGSNLTQTLDRYSTALHTFSFAVNKLKESLVKTPPAPAPVVPVLPESAPSTGPPEDAQGLGKAL